MFEKINKLYLLENIKKYNITKKTKVPLDKCANRDMTNRKREQIKETIQLKMYSPLNERGGRGKKYNTNMTNPKERKRS